MILFWNSTDEFDSPPESPEPNRLREEEELIEYQGATHSSLWGEKQTAFCLLCLSYLLQPMVTTMCLKHFGSQRTDRHRGAGGNKALWEMTSLWPFWTRQAIFPPMCCPLLSLSRGDSLSLSPRKDHSAALTETSHPIAWLLHSAWRASSTRQSHWRTALHMTWRAHSRMSC